MLSAMIPLLVPLASAAPVDTAPSTVSLDWVILPAYATEAAPQDPTLLRMGIPLAQIFSDIVGGQVRVAARDERDDYCDAKRGRCPMEIAALLHSDRVVTMNLSETMDRLQLRVYAGRLGVIQETEIECTWTGGRPLCDENDFAAFARQVVPQPLDENTVEAAFQALRPRLDACRSDYLVKKDAVIRFRLTRDGLAKNVTVNPQRLQTSKPYACMARVVEGLRVPPFGHADRRYFQFSLAN